MAFNHIAVIGAGAWGTALALTCARAGRNVTLWEPDAANAAQLADKRESRFLPGVRIDDSIAIAADSPRPAARDGDSPRGARAGRARGGQDAGAADRRRARR